ncbi:hypothetical protein GB937_010793 [Aspergillus fischeri]|nr:hypothetical protein GB937_010793 [Aspergillus fischeri]
MAIRALEQATENAYMYLKARQHKARSHCFLDLQGKIPRGDPRRDAEIKKLTAAELGPDKFVPELKLMANPAVEPCMELMGEDPERQRRRQYLLKEEEKVLKAAIQDIAC